MYRHSRLYAVISYITWIGFVIAFIGRDPADPLVRRHLNQALLINILETISRILGRFALFGPVTFIIDLAVLVFFFMGIIRALNMDSRPLPLIGEIELIH
ncbi:MAG: hypothetical protein IJQ41_01825 [Firmicutes bacterium]|nr:hypothetical protein [Bacillota bacterium]MBR0209458.1 hypothetical protein [Bacillota bacterium]